MKKLGPHCIRPTAPALEWSRRAPVVKALDDTAPLRSASASAIKVFRHFFPDQPLTAAPRTVADAILGALGDYRDPNLYVEVYNEIPGQDTAQYATLLSA